MHFAGFRSTSLRVSKFLQIKDPFFNFWGEPIFQNVWIVWSPLLYLNLKQGRPYIWDEHLLQNVWIIWSPLLFFNFKRFLDPNSSPFIRFQSILHESGWLFSESWNSYKLKTGDVISGGNQFCRMSELFGPPFCISILKLFYTQILRHLLAFNAFCMI